MALIPLQSAHRGPSLWDTHTATTADCCEILLLLYWARLDGFLWHIKQPCKEHLHPCCSCYCFFFYCFFLLFFVTDDTAGDSYMARTMLKTKPKKCKFFEWREKLLASWIINTGPCTIITMKSGTGEKQMACWAWRAERSQRRRQGLQTMLEQIAVQMSFHKLQMKMSFCLSCLFLWWSWYCSLYFIIETREIWSQ